MRKFKGKARLAVWALAAVFTIFQLYIEATTPLPPFVQKSIHILLGFSLILLLYPMFKGKTQGRFLIFDIILILAVIAFTSRHIITGWGRLPFMEAAMPSARDIVLGVLLLLLTLEVSRRTLGTPVVIVTIIFVIYAFVGPYIPGPLGHEGVDPTIFVAFNYFTDVGIYGLSIDLSTGVLFAVVGFGAFMLSLGGGDVLVKGALALAGQYRGGPAKVAVVGSALFGTISGSSTANVVATGVFTIPMMKKIGYPPEFAGAVEAAASTGGQIMPPVMGATAFIMAEFLGISYYKLLIFAVLPAIAYYATIFIQVHLEAVKRKLKPSAPEDRIAFRRIPKVDWVLLLPLAVFVYLLLGPKYGVTTTAFYATVSTWVCFVIHELAMKHRVDFKRLVLSLEEPAKQMLAILAACACMGIIIYSVEVTGLATKISMVMVDWAGGNVYLLLFFTMLASLILGMGLPTIACYIFLAIMAVPALIQAGISPLAANFFVFWFGIISGITPPVCMTSYVAAGIAGTSGLKVGVQAVKLGISGYIIPYMLCLSPALLLQGPPAAIIADSLALLVGTTGIAVSVSGYLLRPLNIPLRISSAIGGGLLVFPGLVTHIIGAGLLALVVVIQLLQSRAKKEGSLKASVAG